ncbi:hypothetical protein GCM10020001_063650 [Nonomuraea salmonea]
MRPQVRDAGEADPARGLQHRPEGVPARGQRRVVDRDQARGFERARPCRDRQEHAAGAGAGHGDVGVLSRQRARGEERLPGQLQPPVRGPFPDHDQVVRLPQRSLGGQVAQQVGRLDPERPHDLGGGAPRGDRAQARLLLGAVGGGQHDDRVPALRGDQLAGDVAHRVRHLVPGGGEGGPLGGGPADDVRGADLVRADLEEPDAGDVDLHDGELLRERRDEVVNGRAHRAEM